MYLNKNAQVARLSREADDNDKEQYAVVYTSIDINIQPADGEVTALVDGQFGKTYTAFVTASGIAVGDEITVSGTGQIFNVRGVKDWNYGPIPHLELVLFEGDK